MSFRPPLWIPDGRPIMLGHTNGECHSCASIAAQTRFWTRRATDPTVGGDLFQLTEGGKLGLGSPIFCSNIRRTEARQTAILQLRGNRWLPEHQRLGTSKR